MADQPNNLTLPYIQLTQAQTHTTRNEALRILDALTQVPHAEPLGGVRYILPQDAQGIWVGRTNVLVV